MSVPIITRKFTFDAAHRLLNHKGKCANLHGHRYVAEITLQAKQLDSLGMVVDFSEVKKIIGDWIDHRWDHNTILHPDDPLNRILLQEYSENKNLKLPFPLLDNSNLEGEYLNPTVENLTKYLFHQVKALLHNADYSVVFVKIYETENCSAFYQE